MSEHWSKRHEGGGRFAIWLIRTIALKCGRGAARACLLPITLYFYFRRPYERRVSYAFLERATGRPASAWQVLRHIHRFAGTILDRVFLLAERYARFDVRMHGHAAVDVQRVLHHALDAELCPHARETGGAHPGA